MTSTVIAMTYRYDISRLEKARLLKGWSMVKLAEQSGLAWTTVQRALTGGGVAEATVAALAKALRVPMGELVVADDRGDET